MELSSWADYETANDPDELRQLVFAEIFDWEDTNSDGQVEESELTTSYGKKTIVKWKTEGFDPRILPKGEVRYFVCRFSTGTISETKQGKTMLFDFELDALGL